MPYDGTLHFFQLSNFKLLICFGVNMVRGAFCLETECPRGHFGRRSSHLTTPNSGQIAQLNQHRSISLKLLSDVSIVDADFLTKDLDRIVSFNVAERGVLLMQRFNLTLTADKDQC